MTPLTILKQLIAIPSVNPMGRPLVGPSIYEAAMSDFLVGFFAEHGIEHQRMEVVTGRDNVIARVEGAPGLPTLLFDAHQDTVPVDDMTITPFQAEVDNGRVYGRGACDVKGGMAAMLCALQRSTLLAPDDRPTVVMACTCDEEHRQRGAAELLRTFAGGREPIRLLPELPDIIVVAEPTELDVAVAHRGVTRWTLTTKGRAAHSSDPSQGENAIYRMAKIVSALEEWANVLAAQPPHPLCGRRTLSVGRIEGGQSVNIVPSQCAIEIDRRTLPGEDTRAVVDQLVSRLRAQTDVDFENLPPSCIGFPLSDEGNAEVAQRLVQSSGGAHRSQIVGLPFCTHAGRYAQAGVPCVVFGPGSIGQAHTRDEWLEIEQLDQASETLYRFCRSFAASP